MKARYVVRITREDVGRRVSVRARIAAEEGEPSTTDTVGHLRSWEGGVLCIERRDGTLAEVPEGQLLAGRVIPPPPAPRRKR